jgi:hypothetical protein
MLVAGFGAILAGSLTGCWSNPTRPATGTPASHIPRTNTNGFPPAVGNPSAAGANPAANTGGVNPVNGGPVSRTTGMPISDAGRGVNMTTGAVGNPSPAVDSPPYFKQQPAVGGAGPIANNANAAMNRGGIAPAAGRNNDPLPPPDPTPGSDIGTPVAPISTVGLDPKPRFQRRTPEFPADGTVQPTSPPPPSGTRGTAALPPLSPP